jgi:hypothetical protein
LIEDSRHRAPSGAAVLDPHAEPTHLREEQLARQVDTQKFEDWDPTLKQRIEITGHILLTACAET